MTLVLREEDRPTARYSLSQVGNEFIVRMRTKDELGLMQPCEWRYTSEEQANSGFELVIALEPRTLPTATDDGRTEQISGLRTTP